MPKSTAPLPEWEAVLSSAAHLQRIIPDAVLVGGTASSVFAQHRISLDADHVLTDLSDRFDKVLADLESVAGWKTARVRRPVLILGSLDGIETGVRQLIRSAPLETVDVSYRGLRIKLPTETEMLRIKGVLILRRNATRDYLDFVALSDHLQDQRVAEALEPFDRLYPHPSGESSLQQLIAQLSHPMPYDLDDVDLSEYKRIVPKWQNWANVQAHSAHLAATLFDNVCSLRRERNTAPVRAPKPPEPF